MRQAVMRVGNPDLAIRAVALLDRHQEGDDAGRIGLQRRRHQVEHDAGVLAVVLRHARRRPVHVGARGRCRSRFSGCGSRCRGPHTGIRRASCGRTDPAWSRGASHRRAPNRARSSCTSRAARASPDRARSRRRRTAARTPRAGGFPAGSASTACATRCCCCRRSCSRCRSCRPESPLRSPARATRNASPCRSCSRRIDPSRRRPAGPCRRSSWDGRRSDSSHRRGHDRRDRRRAHVRR